MIARLSMLIALVSASIMICAIMFVFAPSWIDYTKEYHYLAQMRIWEIPPQSDYRNFDIVQSHGATGNLCFLDATLTIESDLSQDELIAFYNARYYPKYRTPTYNEIMVFPNEDVVNIYIIRTDTRYYCS